MGSRAEAIAAGEKTYNTGKPCKNGHLSDRYTLGGMCLGCLAKQAAGIKAKRAEATRGRFEGLVEHRIFVKKVYHGTVSDYADILRYGDTNTIDQAQAFITLLKGNIST